MLLDAQGMRSILLAAPTMRGPVSTDNVGTSAGDEDDEISRTVSGASLKGDGPALGEDGMPLVAPAIYTKTVTREMPRIEMLFKIIAAPKDRFADTYVFEFFCI
jgi:hypothetical protein